MPLVETTPLWETELREYKLNARLLVAMELFITSKPLWRTYNLFSFLPSSLPNGYSVHAYVCVCVHVHVIDVK